MPTPEILEFAKTLVRTVRDRSIRSCDGLLKPQANSIVARRWKEPGASPAIQTIIPDAVDDTVFHLLHALDEGLLRLKFVSSEGKEIDLTQEGQGELAGWYMGSGGWRAMFSDERHADDSADLRVWPPPKLSRPDPSTGSSPPSPTS